MEVVDQQSPLQTTASSLVFRGGIDKSPVNETVSLSSIRQSFKIVKDMVFEGIESIVQLTLNPGTHSMM